LRLTIQFRLGGRQTLAMLGQPALAAALLTPLPILLLPQVPLPVGLAILTSEARLRGFIPSRRWRQGNVSLSLQPGQSALGAAQGHHPLGPLWSLPQAAFLFVPLPLQLRLGRGLAQPLPFRRGRGGYGGGQTAVQIRGGSAASHQRWNDQKGKGGSQAKAAHGKQGWNAILKGGRTGLAMQLRLLDVDLLSYERGSHATRQAVLSGLLESLATGFVYSSHDLPSDLLDTAYAMLAEFFHSSMAVKQRFHRPEAHGQTGYTGVLVETAADAERSDWKEMLNWSTPLPPNHPLRLRYPLAYPEAVLPEEVVPGITAVLRRFHEAMADFQRRFLRLIAVGLGADESFFEEMVREAPTLTRALRYPPMDTAPAGGHVWAAPHADINLITVLPRATAPGLEVWIDGQWTPATPTGERVIINSGLMLERLSNGRLPSGWHRVIAPAGAPLERYSVVQFCHPRPSTILCPLASCCQQPTPQRFAGVSAADALEDVLFRIKLLSHDQPKQP
jgi:isopenicillin N synthase-like dioxygenase